MDIANVLNASSPFAGSNTSREQLPAAARTPPQDGVPQTESTRVQLSALGQARFASAQTEKAAAGLPNNNNLPAAADPAAAAQDRSAGVAQQGFSFNGVAAYSRVFSS